MELKDTLRAISDDARGWLNAWARDFTDDKARRPIGDSRAPNPLAWQLGHLAYTEEDVAGLFAAGPPPAALVPESLRATCSTSGPAPTGDTEFPPVSDFWALLERTHRRLLDVLDAASPAELERPPRVANPYFQTLGQGIYEAALHENYHVGEIAALRKALGKPRIG